MSVHRISVLFVVLISAVRSSGYHTVSVGIVGGPDDDARQYERKFWSANQTSSVILEPLLETVREWKSVEVTRAICTLLKTGIDVLVAPTTAHRSLMAAYATKFHLPLVIASPPQEPLENAIFFLPDPMQAIADLLKKNDFSSFVFFYDNEDGPSKLKRLLQASNHRMNVDAVWRVSNANQAFHYLLYLPRKKSSPQHVLFATSAELPLDVLTKMSERPQKRTFHFLLIDPVVQTPDNVKTQVFDSSVMTLLSLPSDPTSRLQLENRWHTLLPQLSIYSYETTSTKNIPNSAVVMKDISNILEQAFSNLLEDSSFALSSGGVDCLEDQFTNNARYAAAANRHIKKVVIEKGLTGSIRFSANGERTAFSFDVNEISSGGVKLTNRWESKSGLRTLDNGRKEPLKNDSVKEESTKVIVQTKLDGVLLRLAEDKNKTGNERFQGFLKDVLDNIAEDLNWNYKLTLTSLAPTSDHRSEEAELIVVPFSNSEASPAEMELSKPFLTVGLTILSKKARNFRSIGLSPVAVVKVWSYPVWLLLIVAFGLLAAANYGVSHFTGEPDRIRSLDTKLSDRFSVCSSIWFALGSLTFRETGIYPRSVSHRLLSVFWWCFTLMIFVSYVSSLTIHLLNERAKGDKTLHQLTADEYLRNFLVKGYPRIGSLKQDEYFPNISKAESGILGEYSVYLQKDNTLLVDSLEKGVEKVQKSNGDFALIVNSLHGRDVSSSRTCDTKLTAGYLIHKSLTFGFKPGSKLRLAVDNAILDAMASGEFRRLHEKWWYHNSACAVPNHNVLPGIYSDSLNLREASGVFCFLLCGVIIAGITAVIEYFLRYRKLSVDTSG